MRRRIRDEEHAGELNIVPYLDIVMNLVMFVLLSMTGLVSLGVVNVSAPRIGGDAAAHAPGEAQPRLLLTVAISRNGFHLSGAAGVPGADAASVDPGGPATVPLRADGTYDYAALTAQLQRVKERYPKETNVIFSADAEVSYDTLVQTMDACREVRVKGLDGTVERRPLFYDVSLSLAG
jgi:biopolymer transport protein TolR